MEWKAQFDLWKSYADNLIRSECRKPTYKEMLPGSAGPPEKGTWRCWEFDCYKTRNPTELMGYNVNVNIPKNCPACGCKAFWGNETFAGHRVGYHRAKAYRWWCIDCFDEGGPRDAQGQKLRLLGKTYRSCGIVNSEEHVPATCGRRKCGKGNIKIELDDRSPIRRRLINRLADSEMRLKHQLP